MFPTYAEEQLLCTKWPENIVAIYLFLVADFEVKLRVCELLVKTVKITVKC